MKVSFVLLLVLMITSSALQDAHERLQTTLNTFAAAVNTNNKQLILKLFHWPNANEAALNRAIARFRNSVFIVQSASYKGTERIEGISSSRIGTNVKNHLYVMRKDAASPTNWKIISVKPAPSG